MWTPTTRRQHSRCGLRYETDLTDADWAELARGHAKRSLVGWTAEGIIEPHLPPASTCGRPRELPFRDVFDAIFYVLRGGIAWRLLPNDLPPKSTVFRWFATWRDNGLFQAINHALVMADRERVGREASPTAVVLDSQSVRTTESGGPSGYDAGKKVKGRKRQVMLGTDGRGLMLEPQAASVQDRDGAPLVLHLSRRSFSLVTKAFADSCYAGERPATATSIDVEIVRKPKDQVGFAVHPRRWVVERFFAWISRNRRLWKDPEATLASAKAFLYAASVMILVRRLARPRDYRDGLSGSDRFGSRDLARPSRVPLRATPVLRRPSNLIAGLRGATAGLEAAVVEEYVRSLDGDGLMSYSTSPAPT